MLDLFITVYYIKDVLDIYFYWSYLVIIRCYSHSYKILGVLHSTHYCLDLIARPAHALCSLSLISLNVPLVA